MDEVVAIEGELNAIVKEVGMKWITSWPISTLIRYCVCLTLFPKQYEETKEGVMDDNRRTLLQFI